MQNNAKTKRITKILGLFLVALVLIVVGFVSLPFILSITVREYRVIKGIPAPIQIPVRNGSDSISGPNWTANISFLASYEIQGLVVGVDDYSGNSLYDRIAPRDISLAWGDMAEHNNLIAWQRGEREMNAEVNSLSEWVIGKKYDELFSQYSNNHLIPKDNTILSEIRGVKRGDYIKLKGYLVNVKMYDKMEHGAYYELKSSLVRDDDGDSSCEVMYVIDLEYLD